MVQPLWKIVQWFLNKSNIELPYVLVWSGCYNKISQTKSLKQHLFLIVPEAGK